MKKIIFIFLVFLPLTSMSQSNDYLIGKQYFDKKEYKKAYSYLLSAANKGDSNAQGYLGYMYDWGEGVSQIIPKQEIGIRKPQIKKMHTHNVVWQIYTLMVTG